MLSSFNHIINFHQSVCLYCRNKFCFLFSSSFSTSNKPKGIERIEGPAWILEQEQLWMDEAEVQGSAWGICFAGENISHSFPCSISSSLQVWFFTDQHTEVRVFYLRIFGCSSLYSSYFSNHSSHTGSLVCCNISGFEEKKEKYS